MKKLLYCAAALAMLLFAGSCQRENLEPDAASGTVTFTVKAPETLVTKAESTINDGATIADGENVNVVHYAVYKTNSEKEADIPNALELEASTPMAQGKVKMEHKNATATFDLLQDQEYTILFWAQVSTSEDGMNKYYDLGDLRKIQLKQNDENEYDGNNEERAAFYARYDFSTEKYMNHTVTLYRPFSQLNLLTTNESLEPKYEGQTSASYTIDVKESMVTVHGTSSTFDMINGTGLPGEDQTFSMFASPEEQGQETLTVNEVAYHYVSMNYLFVPEDEALLTVDYEIVTDKGNVTNTVPNVPLKENFRTNIIGNLLTKETQFNIVVDQRFNEEIDENLSSEDIYLTDVDTDEDLEKALRRTEEHIVINLGGETQVKSGVEPKEYSVAISAWVEEYYFGSANTKSITINANGNKINFKHKNTDWNYIRCVNDDTKWIINDAKLTNSGHNDGPWNRHDIRFYNAVELNNVTSDKAIALLNDGTLNNVSITEDAGVYGLWITSEGQTVDIDGLSIIATNEGRGIKIADEYVDSPTAVELNIKNSSFETAKKAAILVTSSAGAEINWGEGNDISKVAEDIVNAVWVDEDRAEYSHLVNVDGANKKIESAEVIADGFFKVSETGAYVISTSTGFKKFAESVNSGTTYKGCTVKLDADIDLQNESWTPIGPNADAGNKFYGTFDGQNLTIYNLKVATADDYTAAGLFGALNGTAKNFTIDGADISHISTGAATDNGIAVVAGSLYSYGNVENVTVLNANVKGNRYVGAIAGYVYGNILNCTVKKVNLTATPDNLTGSYDNGDKVGAIAGYFASEDVYNITGNVVENATLVGYRDMGVVVGTANGADRVSGNIVKGQNYVTVDRTYYYGDKDDNAGEVVGRITAGTLGENTVEGTVTISHPVTPSEINAAIADGGDYTFTEDVEGKAVSSSGYGATGMVVEGSSVIDGNGNTLWVNDANSTWDCAIAAKGGTIKNLTVGGAFRGIFMPGANADLYIDNVTIDNVCYTFNSDAGSKNYEVKITNSTLNGWTSYSNVHKYVTFENCQFGKGSGGYRYAFCRPYNATTFKGCNFEEGYEIDAIGEIIFEDCTLNGESLTVDNIHTLVTSGIKNVKDVNGVKQGENPGVWQDGEGNYIATSTEGLDKILSDETVTTVKLATGNYTLPSVSDRNVTINGAEDVVITVNKPNYSGSDVTLNNVTVKGSGYATGIQHVKTVTYNGAKIIGDMCLYGESVVFNECTFELNNQYIWTYGAEKVEFNNCTFNTNGKAILVYNEGAGASNVTVKGCTFNATAGAKASAIANQNCAAIEIDNFQSNGTGAAHVVTTENNTFGEYFSGEWRIKNFVAGNYVTVNGVEYSQIAVDGKLMTIDSNKNVTVNE